MRIFFILILFLFSSKLYADDPKKFFGVVLGWKYSDNKYVKSIDEINKINSIELLDKLYFDNQMIENFEKIYEPPLKNKDFNHYLFKFTPISGTVYLIMGFGNPLEKIECSNRINFYSKYFTTKYKDGFETQIDQSDNDFGMVISPTDGGEKIIIVFRCEAKNDFFIIDIDDDYQMNSILSISIDSDIFLEELEKKMLSITNRKKEVTLSQLNADTTGL